MRIIVATNNVNKLNELKSKLQFEVLGQTDLGIEIDVEEIYDTLEENAMLKASTIAKMYPEDIVIADDTGLFIESLNFEPGVYSKRYAGTGCSEDNNDLVLKKLEGKDNRYAFFKTVLAVCYKSSKYLFDGIVEGEITTTRIGENGFGYDSIFYLSNIDKTMAQLSKEEKNIFSHRAKAIDNFISSDFMKRMLKEK